MYNTATRMIIDVTQSKKGHGRRSGAEVRGGGCLGAKPVEGRETGPAAALSFEEDE